jgi:hypothetical protein
LPRAAKHWPLKHIAWKGGVMRGLETEAAPVKGAGLNACPIKSLAYSLSKDGFENEPGWDVVVRVNYKI